MDKTQELAAVTIGALSTTELEECNALSARYGLWLSEAEAGHIQERRRAALYDADRVEFGGGVVKALIYAFCDSPYIERESWADILCELQDCFYYIKSESMESIADDEVIACMKEYFDGVCEGSVDCLAGSCTEALLRMAKGLDDDE